MTDEKNQPQNTTFDLKNHAEEALRLYEEARRKKSLEENTIDVMPDEGNTTFDLSEEARAAQHLHEQEAGDGGSQPDTVLFGLDMLLELHILEAAEPIQVDVQGEMIIGRGDNSADFQPDVDMSPYGAYRLGISRRHAMLRRNGTQLELIDPGSRNGSSVNGVQVEANTPQRLKDGDELRLGNLVMHVRFRAINT